MKKVLRANFQSSSSLDEAAYSSQNGLLLVRFKSGSWYQYSSVPLSIAEELLNGVASGTIASAGKFFGKHIRQSYSSERLTEEQALILLKSVFRVDRADRDTVLRALKPTTIELLGRDPRFMTI